MGDFKIQGTSTHSYCYGNYLPYTKPKLLINSKYALVDCGFYPENNFLAFTIDDGIVHEEENIWDMMI